MQLQPSLLLSWAGRAGRLFDLFAGWCIKTECLEKLVIRCFTICKGSMFRATPYSPRCERRGREKEVEEDTFQAKRRWRKLKGSSFTIWMIIQVFLHSWDLSSLSLFFLFGKQFRFSYFETDEWIKYIYIYICIWNDLEDLEFGKESINCQRNLRGKGSFEISKMFRIVNF